MLLKSRDSRRNNTNILSNESPRRKTRKNKFLQNEFSYYKGKESRISFAIFGSVILVPEESRGNGSEGAPSRSFRGVGAPCRVSMDSAVGIVWGETTETFPIITKYIIGAELKLH